MRVLAIESSTSRPSVAIASCTPQVSDDHTAMLASLFSATESTGKNDPVFQLIARADVGCRSDVISAMPFADTSRSLVPKIQVLLKEAGLSANEVDLLAVSRGPGSFTGVRIGVVVAKAFCYAAGSEIVGVDVMPTLAIEARSWLAANVPDETQFTIGVAVDAGRGEIFGGIYACDCWRLSCLDRPRIHRADSWLATMQPGSVLIGSGIRNLDTQQITAAGHLVVTADTPLPRAETIAKVGVAQFLQRGGDDVWKLNPVYARPSAAEEAHRTVKSSRTL